MEKQRLLQEKLQREAAVAHNTFGNRSTVAASVGSGKSVIFINKCKELYEKNNKCKIIYSGARIVYSENLKQELAKFNLEHLMDNIEFCCNKSLHKYYAKRPDFICVDEAHLEVSTWLPKLEKYYHLNSNIQLLCLTGTPNFQKEFKERIDKLVPISYNKKLDDSIEEKLINDYNILVVYHELDQKLNIKVKTKQFDFTTSEQKTYNNLYKKYCSVVSNQKFPKELQNLKFFFKNLNSKLELAKAYIQEFKDKKVLVYAGSIKQANQFKMSAYHSDLSDESRAYFYQRFCTQKTGVLINVAGLKEAVSIPNLSHGIIMSPDASKNSLTQQIGRFCRLIPEKEQSTIIIFVAKNTIEEKWFKKACEDLDESKIKYI